MIQAMISLFREAISGAAALQNLAGIIAHHRIQSSPGFRQAAHFCLERLRAAGVPAQVLAFPGDGVTEYWGHPAPQEWSAQAATLRLVAPEEEARVLADYREEKIALIQRSLATPAGGVEAEVVVLEDGEEEAEYEGLGVRGKVVLTRGDVERVRELAVERHGALGILFDGMRETPPVRPLLSLEARQYTSFWWERAGPTATRCFGFVLTPQQGEALRRLVKKEARQGRAVRVRAEVDASFCAGSIEVVEGFLPGESAEEVWLVAHLCHPQPSANDNASGAAVLLEVAGALARLLEAGTLSRPRRGIRFLLVPEMTGTYAYLATHEEYIPQVVAALNLDMVGEDQGRCGSTLNLTSSPLATPSLSDDLLALILQEVAVEGKGFMGASDYALFRWVEASFSGGSDHCILADPTIGIPCPMLLQWPDRFYHTSADTLDKVDPAMLGRVGVAAATYLWWLATAGPWEARWLGQAMVGRTEARLGQMRQDWLDKVLSRRPAPSPEEQAEALAEFQARVELWLEHRRASLVLLKRLAGGGLPRLSEWQEEIEEAGRREVRRARSALLDLLGADELPPLPTPPRDEWEERAAGMVPRRLGRGPVSPQDRLHLLPPEERDAWWPLLKEWRGGVAPILALYWTDGRRTLLQIADRVEQECGQRDVQKLVRYYELLEKLGLVEIERTSG